MVSWQYRWFSSLVALLPARLKVKLLYFRRFKQRPNLRSPSTFNEKVNWRKLNEFEPLFTIAADKIASKDWVTQLCPNILVPDTLWQGTSFKKLEDWLDENELPQQFVVKSNHGSRMNLFYQQGQSQLDFTELEKIRRRWFKHDQYSTLGEWGYKNIEKRVFVEAFLDFKGTVPDDYKFFVYHGKVHFIQLDTGRFNGHHRNIFDRNWNDLNIDFSHPSKVPSPTRPECFTEMVEAAEKIGRYFSFVRVDFYQLDGRVYFGELTLYPGAGYEVFPTSDIDLLFGQPWNINLKPEVTVHD